ncbi:hypothetical protein [Aquimarina algiphila]|uniref:hypothetical protein n=1 Tax=Aquimarina algiphila TaxID=2047982 RepID=UPI00232D12F0|nr:hypothetical protein [Aquimarina algiphila]
MKFSKNTKKAGLTLVGSMLGFIIAKKYSPKETYPFILIGGFLGSVLGEELIVENSITGDLNDAYGNVYK